jgi:hypothetical protein
MTVVALVLFAVAAVIGLTMAVQRLQGAPHPSTGVALSHGGVAAVALVLAVIAAVAADPVPALAVWAIALFVVAALGGAVLFLGYHLRGRELPVPVVFVHGGVAVVGFVLLLAAAITG